MSGVESSMKTFGDDLLKRNKHAFEIRSEKASQAKDQEEANKLRFDTSPWWRLADGEELAYLVSHKSVNLIENCDLPHPLTSRFTRGGPYGHSGHFTPSLHLNARAATNNKQGHCTSTFTEAQDSESDPTKVELLEALSHCQTRAREAERLAKHAYAEKEHIIKLFFREASQLFAYKQWFQLLQLENTNFQNKINEYSNENGGHNDQMSSILCCVDLPSVDLKTRKLHKMKKNPARKKYIRKQNICDYLRNLGVSFAIGLGLGAGLLLGWAIGWFLP